MGFFEARKGRSRTELGEYLQILWPQWTQGCVPLHCRRMNMQLSHETPSGAPAA